MDFTRKQRSKAAVAPVLATLLMIAVAVAMSVIIFMWSQGFLSNTSGSVGAQQGAQNQAAQSSVSIESATFVACDSSLVCTKNASPYMTIIVRNVGAVPVTLGSLSITGLSSNTGFTGSLSISTISATSSVMTGTDSKCTGGTDGMMESASGSVTLAKGAATAITVAQSGAANACLTSNRIASGDTIALKVTTSAGTFAASQYTVP